MFFQAKLSKETVSNVLEKKSSRSSSGAKPMTPKRATKRVMRSSLTPEEIGKTPTEAETVAVS